MKTDDIDLNDLSEIKKSLGVAEDNNDYIYIKGVGIIWETGKLNLEGLVKELLNSKYITNPKYWSVESKDSKKEE